jgi:hypothetical protein
VLRMLINNYTRCNSITEYVKLAVPEDDPLGWKYIVLRMLINNYTCCNSITEYVKLAVPEYDSLGWKHSVTYVNKQLLR